MNESKTAEYWHFSQKAGGKFESSNPEPDLREIWRANEMGVKCGQGGEETSARAHCAGQGLHTASGNAAAPMEFCSACACWWGCCTIPSWLHFGKITAAKYQPLLSVWKEKYSTVRRIRKYTAPSGMGCKEKRTILLDFTGKIYLTVNVPNTGKYTEQWDVLCVISFERHRISLTRDILNQME